MNKFFYKFLFLSLTFSFASIPLSVEEQSSAENKKPVDANNANKRNNPIMTDADMAMKMDPIYRDISLKFMNDQDYFSRTFARAWFCLLYTSPSPRDRG